MAIIAKAFSLSSLIVDLRNVFILFSVEKHLSDSNDVMGFVTKILSRLTTVSQFLNMFPPPPSYSAAGTSKEVQHLLFNESFHDCEALLVQF